MESNTTIARQRTEDEASIPIPMRLDPRSATPVFGTAQPSTGAVGKMRERAYSRPAHDPQRWMLLLAADRAERAALVGRETVMPGRQLQVVRHVARQVRAQPEGYAAAAGALLLGGLAWVLTRRSSSRG